MNNDVIQMDVEDFIAHYGRKGMKWGVITAEPTKEERRQAKQNVKTAKREAKAKTFDAKASIFDKQVSELTVKSATATRGQKYQIQEDLATAKLKRDRAVKDAEAVRAGKMTSTQKKVVIGASVVTAILAARAIAIGIQSGQFTQLAAKGKAFLNGEQAFNFKKNDALKSSDLDADQINSLVAKGVNPDFGAIGTKMNCRRCTFAYEMRRRGFEVEATRTTTASGQNVVGLANAITPGKRTRDTSMTGTYAALITDSVRKARGKSAPTVDLMEGVAAGGRKKLLDTSSGGILDALSREPDGSRGELGVMWGMGGGHSMAYEIVKGKAVIFDTQSGKKYDDKDSFAGMASNIASAGFTRLDDLPLNTDYLLRWVKGAD